ncbi:DNA repair protein RecN [Rubrobacter xylanophilus]|uniref:DNA repair protein RecN n=1 Tax=Rubrobacter xylanophilus TaxID=49319 RepID=UPI00155ABE23|nr:DNA repair protein RecN [Rubrobacter xylanophilus]
MASGAEDLSVVLSEISVRNVALIESATLRLSPGLNAVTGETGAGKTLLATALQLLLGGRARAEVVRAGEERAEMEGLFELPEGVLREILPAALGDLAEEVDPRDGLLLRRTITADGRSRCYVNGVSVGVRVLAALGERLVSYHGQREQARLADPAEQLALLDAFVGPEGLEALRERAELWRSVEEARRRLEEIRASGEARLRELDFLRYQIGEIEASGYSREEMERLLAERERLRNVTGLLEAAAAAAAALAPEEGGGAVEAVSAAASELERASRLDGDLGPLAERLAGASAELGDVLYELRAYLDELEANPERLEEVENRLAELRELERKYGEDVPGYLRRARERLSGLENADEETGRLEEWIFREERRLAELGEEISAARREAARHLAERVQENLKGLRLDRTLFRAELVPCEPGPSGNERVEFVIRPNPGEPELPVRRYASGGELSRIMLALRLAQREPDPSVTYIFDEVDAGIGGETATAVGSRLRELGGRCQVITITHLPQIASEASSHVVVSKEEVSGRTVTRIRRVEGEERRRELARMLSGRVDRVSLAHASNLLVGGGG